MNEIAATIHIDQSDILNEIAKLTSYMGAKDKDASMYERLTTIDEDREFFDRVFLLARSECAEMLYPYTKQEILPHDTPMTYDTDICLSIPKRFSHTTIVLLNNLIKEYIINRLMSEWIMITSPEKHSYWIERCASTKRQISTALMSRTAPLKRMLRPF